jgi:hypothetical protein
MILKQDLHMDELLAKGGTFDITGTTNVNNKQFWGFTASDGAVISAIKGVPIGTSVANLAAIRNAEEDISSAILTGASDPLFAGAIYRPKGYIITSITLTSGNLHCFKTKNQVSE